MQDGIGAPNDWYSEDKTLCLLNSCMMGPSHSAGTSLMVWMGRRLTVALPRWHEELGVDSSTTPDGRERSGVDSSIPQDGTAGGEELTAALLQVVQITKGRMTCKG